MGWIVKLTKKKNNKVVSPLFSAGVLTKKKVQLCSLLYVRVDFTDLLD